MTAMAETPRQRRADLVRSDLLLDLEARGLLRFVRMVPPDRAAGTDRTYVVDYGSGEVELAAGDVAGWVRGFEAGLGVERPERPLAERVENMEQASLRELQRLVTAELKARRS